MNHEIDVNVHIRIKGVIYKQEQATVDNIKMGDPVFDRGDFTHGIIDMIKGDKVAIKSGWAAEVGVPLTRVSKLTEIE